MSKEVEKDEEWPSGPPVVKDRFPRIVIVIIMTEFCERFSFSGMRAFLTLYLRSKLGYSDDGATEMYHIFSTFIYFFPIIGGITADNYLGKYRTILYLMFVYLAGNLLVAVTAIPSLQLPPRLCTLLGLFMITVGAGGIKPCVAAFGGDQFKLPHQEKHLSAYFSILYFSLCTGSLIAKTVSPILRSEIHCFGDKDCYSMAFGAPGFIVLLSIVIFVSARNHYVIKKPEGNVVVDFVKCVSIGLKNAVLKRSSNENHAHWLDSMQHRYDQRFIKDIKKTLEIMMLFTVLPVFWALLDQMGSRWTLQATKMGGKFWFFSVKPDQMQVIAPIFILALIPFFQKYAYPFLEKRSILKNPLHKLTLGGFLAGVAFIASALVEIYLKTTYPQLPQPGFSQLRIFNGNPCHVTIYNHNTTYTISPLSHFTEKHYEVTRRRNLTFKMNGTCVKGREKSFLLDENSAVSFFLNGNDFYRFKDSVEKSKAGFPVVRILSSHTSNLTLFNEKLASVEVVVDKKVLPQVEMFTSTYSLKDGNHTVASEIKLEMGGVYTILVNKVNGSYNSSVIVITEPNSITMAWLIPQFLILSTAEVLFAVTGNEFAFKESPESMKAVITAVWLLTEAVGNVIIIIVTRVFATYQQETQSFIYTGMIFFAITVFHFMAKNYQHRPAQATPQRRERSNSEYLYLQVKQAEDCLDH